MLKRLKIGGMDYTVEIVKDLKNDRGEKLWGQHLPTEQAIKLDASITLNQRKLEVLMHEVFHALYDHFELADNDSEERIVSCLSNGVFMVLRDNPGLLKELMEVV